MIELMQPEYNPLNLQQKPIYRWNDRGRRYYFTIDNDEATFYPSVTTIINDATPESPTLLNMRMEMGKDYTKFMRKKARHGTFMHIIFAEYLKEKKVDFGEVKVRYKEFMADKDIEVTWFEVEDFAKHLLSLFAWVNEYNVEPILIEQVVTYNDGKYKFAGALDLYCECDFGKNRVRAIVDLKSGAYSGFFREHEIQLHMYKMAFYHTFKQDVDIVANLSPKNWRKEPTYDFKNQTNSTYAAAIRSILELAQIYGNYNDPSPILSISGEVTPDSTNFEFIPASKYVLNLSKTKQGVLK